MTKLYVENLDVLYDKISVLYDISIKVENGQIVALLGANGSGKSTLLKSIAGVVPPRQGIINFDNKTLIKLTPQQIVRLGIVLVPEGRQIFTEQTVEDNLLLGTYTRQNISRTVLIQELDSVFKLFPVLKAKKKQLANYLSGGEQQMLAIASKLMTKPKLLMLDEPSLGLAPLIIREVYKTLLNLKNNGLTILLVEQNARIALEIADYIYILKNGRITEHGSSGDIANKMQMIKDAYLS